MNETLRGRIQTLSEARREHIRRLREHPRGLSWCEDHTDIIDEVLRALYDHAVTAFPNVPPLALIATGGYGRRELSPYSDLDITVVPSDESSQDLDDAIRQLFQDVHAVFQGDLKMVVGYAYRLLGDAPGLDPKTRTGLIDMRLIAGSHELFLELQTAVEDTFSAGEFVLNKIREREEMFRKYHDTPYVVEPHLKEGAGGVRCFHCANWIGVATGERAARPPHSYDEVVKARNLLHLVAGRPQDHLTRVKQVEIADVLGVPVAEFMGGLVTATERLHSYYRRATDKILESRFELADSVLAVQGEIRWTGGIDAGEAAVGVSLATQLGLRVSDLQAPPATSINGPAAIFALSTGERTIRNLERCGLLRQLLPELTDCRVVLPVDTVHRYTVYEHTLRAVRQIDELRAATFFGDLAEDVTDREALYLALLLHDVARGESEDRHPELGAKIARKRCEEWRISDDQTEIVCWLIEHHLVMSRFVRVRDIQNPKTVEEFVGFVKDLDRLRLLTLFTYADVRAVDDSTWTSAFETFMRELFERSRALLEGQFRPIDDPAVYRLRLLRQLKSTGADEDKLNEFLSSLPSYYLLSTPPDVVRLHMNFVQKAIVGEPSIELFHRQDIHATDVTVCALDRRGVLTKLLALIYAYDLSVSGIRAMTTTSEPHVALDVFTVSFSGKPMPAATSQQLNNAILEMLEDRLDTDQLLRSRGKDPDRNQRVLTHTYTTGSPSILEIRSPRGRGMAFRLSRLISRQGWNVVAARVGQWAGNATAAFYIQGANGEAPTAEAVEQVMAGLRSE